MSLDEAVPIAIQIASALDAARRAGITHRDLKPGNRMLTKSGATLLDFGLAKQGAESAGGAGRAGALAGVGAGLQTGPPEMTALPTTPQNLTAQGTILGARVQRRASC